MSITAEAWRLRPHCWQPPARAKCNDAENSGHDEARRVLLCAEWKPDLGTSLPDLAMPPHARQVCGGRTS